MTRAQPYVTERRLKNIYLKICVPKVKVKTCRGREIKNLQFY